jgi:hypothetical protein
LSWPAALLERGGILKILLCGFTEGRKERGGASSRSWAVFTFALNVLNVHCLYCRSFNWGTPTTACRTRQNMQKHIQISEPRCDDTWFGLVHSQLSSLLEKCSIHPAHLSRSCHRTDNWKYWYSQMVCRA